MFSWSNLLAQEGSPKAEWHLEVRSGSLRKIINLISSHPQRGGEGQQKWKRFSSVFFLALCRLDTAAVQGDPWGLGLHFLALPGTTAFMQRAGEGKQESFSPSPKLCIFHYSFLTQSGFLQVLWFPPCKPPWCCQYRNAILHIMKAQYLYFHVGNDKKKRCVTDVNGRRTISLKPWWQASAKKERV